MDFLLTDSVVTTDAPTTTDPTPSPKVPAPTTADPPAVPAAADAVAGTPPSTTADTLAVAADADGPAPEAPPSDDVIAAVRRYRELGVAVARIKKGEKQPTDHGWPERSAEPDEFRPGDNVGLQCGWLSDGGTPGRFLVCVDLDSADAVAKADDFLPPTAAVEGRPGKPRSHWWYFVTGVPAEAASRAAAAAAAAKRAGKHPGPAIKHLRNATETVVDFLGTGGQAVAPPSRHEKGEVRGGSLGTGWSTRRSSRSRHCGPPCSG